MPTSVGKIVLPEWPIWESGDDVIRERYRQQSTGHWWRIEQQRCTISSDAIYGALLQTSGRRISHYDREVLWLRTVELVVSVYIHSQNYVTIYQKVDGKNL
jgi:hypothetical protein